MPRCLSLALLACLLGASASWAQEPPPAEAAPVVEATPADPAAAPEPPETPAEDSELAPGESSTTATFEEPAGEPEPAVGAAEEGTDEDETAYQRPAAGYQEVVGRTTALSDGLVRASVVGSLLRTRRGYTPVLVSLANATPEPRTLRLEFSASYNGGRRFSRVVELAPLQRLTTVLPVPASAGSGVLRLQGVEDSTPAPLYMDEPEGAAVMVIGSTRAFESSTSLKRVSRNPRLSVRFLTAQEAPAELAAYVGHEAVVLAEDSTALSAEAWAALEAYAATGGSLVLARPARDVATRLPLLKETRPGLKRYGFGRVRLCGQTAPCGQGLLEDTEANKPPVQPVGPASRWERRRYMLREGITPLLSGVQAPVGRFLFLIFLFVLAVGPGGLMLARRKGPVALLVAVPSIALATCLALVAWSVLVDGFSIHASRYTLSRLDRPGARVVTLGLGAYYANLPPDAVRLTALSALVQPESVDETLVDLDWTQGLSVEAGFLPSRTYREWGEVAVVPSRARLVARAEGPAVRVQNALGAPVERGLLHWRGRTWSLPALAEGAEGVAAEIHAEQEKSTLQSLGPEGLGNRFAQEPLQALYELLREGEFLVVLGGVGPAPSSALAVELEKGHHLMRGEVDTP